MSTRQVGNRYENDAAAELEAIGYFCYPSRGSRGIDLIALATDEMALPHLGLEVGGSGKRLGVAFAKMRENAQFPGMLLLVALSLMKKRRRVLRWYAREDHRGGHHSVIDAIAEARTL